MVLKKQVLWERGLWVGGMGIAENLPPEKNMATVLSNCNDFKNEKTALQHLVESRGHILLMSPKCHPELAGLGIEYSWGMSKLKFRRKTNDENPRKLRENMVASMCPKTILTLGRVRRFARRTRDLGRGYIALAKIEAEGGPPIDSKDMIEHMRKKHKADRNILDLEPGLIDRQ